MAGASERAVGDNLGRRREVGVRQHHHRVLRAALALDAFARGRRAGVDVPRHGARAHEADGLNLRVIEDRVHHVAAAVDDVDDTGRQAGPLDELHQQLHGQRHSFGRLDHHRVAAGDCVGQEPERDHPGKVERGNDGAHPQRLADHDFVDACGDVLGVVALHEQRGAAGHFHVLDRPPQLTARLADGLAAFAGDGGRQMGRCAPRAVLSA